jgi:hypothetical protein|tara:strand:+ start:2587 stop:2715 length:129 start_codon:yes stop_codon:yes gene_type:complete
VIKAKTRSEAEQLADKYLEEHPEIKEVEYEYDVDDVGGKDVK